MNIYTHTVIRYIVLMYSMYCYYYYIVNVAPAEGVVQVTGVSQICQFSGHILGHIMDKLTLLTIETLPLRLLCCD